MTSRHETAHGGIVVELDVNGERVSAEVEPRLLLSDFLRHRLRLTGTHVGCEHGVCGACTVLVDGLAQRSCLIFAAQADGARVRTIEGLAPSDTELHPVQRAFAEAHGLQCGFCTPGFVMSTVATLEQDPAVSDEDLLDALSGHLCRCTGYRGIVEAAHAARDQAGAAGEVTSDGDLD
ncbi:(2Fe-2S)-binding protein [Aeromicrobium sp. YIM 150415]|uniref:(2Fe-2S)-binding protein n=1 Tax=Aeromicrobium sp. YIM 150415 TaxID=2803912 RepID=UPI001962F0B3|nr:(2Fe-2S)-binding protein [Aeromicrobium sp. YIM 150415]MBM9464515.1 (2Fe-2S)-binding protein [Aeromicrobium sp. YIM 150415]